MPQVMNQEELEHLIDAVKDYQLMHGLVLKGVHEQSSTRVNGRTLGISVLPTPFPRQYFDQAHALQQSMNLLYMRVAADVEWLSSVITPLLEIDDLARALWTVYQNIKKQDRVICGIFQSAYMLHSDETIALKQVEMDTFAMTGACHAQFTAELHHRLDRARQDRQSQAQHKFVPAVRRPGELMMNENVHNLAKSLRLALALYSQKMVAGKPCILMIVQDQSINIADERPIEHAIDEVGVVCYRCKWKDITNLTVLTSDNVLLFCHLNIMVEVGVVYYRAGYQPEEYDEQGIKARTRLETSHAIKCPDILTHLATFKSVQCALSKPRAIERFMSPEEAGCIQGIFMPMQALDNTTEGKQASEEASLHTAAEQYVLKPNLEGAAMNVFGKQIARFLRRVREDDRGKYVLIRRIAPVSYEGVLLREHMVYEGKVTSELGILGTCIWKRVILPSGQHEIDVISNETAGWTFRTRPIDVRQSSVLRGFGCLDTPALTD